MRWSVFNQKGGVGKTSIACNLAAAMAHQGRKTLVVDLDAQANASRYLLGDHLEAVTKTVTDFFESTLAFKLFREHLQQAVVPSPWPNLAVIPADASLGELTAKLESRYKIFKLRDAVQALVDSEGYEVVFFDSPPAQNFFSVSALIASERVLVPFDCDAFSADALIQVEELIREIASDHCPDLRLHGVVVNQFQAQANLPRKAIGELQERGLTVLEPYLASSVVMRESHAADTPLPFFKPRHRLSEQFLALAAALEPRRSSRKRSSRSRSKSARQDS